MDRVTDIIAAIAGVYAGLLGMGTVSDFRLITLILVTFVMVEW